MSAHLINTTTAIDVWGFQKDTVADGAIELEVKHDVLSLTLRMSLPEAESVIDAMRKAVNYARHGTEEAPGTEERGHFITVAPGVEQWVPCFCRPAVVGTLNDIDGAIA